jgi:hypothetical protein
MPSQELDLTGVSEDAVHLRDLMSGILERVEATFQSYNVELPQRRYWTMGQPAIDCEQLVVSFLQMYLGAPGDQAVTPQRCHVPRTAVVAISVARQTPVVGMNGRPPAPRAIEAAAEVSAIDSWVLMDSVNLLDQWDSSGFGPGVIATLETAGAEGGYQTVTMQLTMAVP